MPLAAVGGLAVLTLAVVDAPGWTRWSATAVFVVGMALYLRLGTPTGQAVSVAAPVRGSWLAMNSPTSRVPSHGIQAWAQAYAVDLVYDPADGSRPGWGRWPPARRPTAFPGFGLPVLAPVTGTVVRAQDGARDHLSRTSPPALLYRATRPPPGHGPAKRLRRGRAAAADRGPGAPRERKQADQVLNEVVHPDRHHRSPTPPLTAELLCWWIVPKHDRACRPVDADQLTGADQRGRVADADDRGDAVLAGDGGAVGHR
jgi:hypothetical protein